MAKPKQSESVNPSDSTQSLWQVSVAATTPLKENPLTVEAESPEAAWVQFCIANGITSTRCPRTIVKA